MHKACCISFSRHRGEGKYVDMSENETVDSDLSCLLLAHEQAQDSSFWF